LATKNANSLASLARGFFSPLTVSFYIFGQLFSDFASKNTELLASVGECLEKVIHTLDT
jgi:hypothetical protein